MALSKNKELESGVIGNYFKVTQFILNKMEMKMFCKLELFLNEAHKNGKALETYKTYNFPVSSQELSGDIIELAYDKIKSYSNEVVSPTVTYLAAIQAVEEVDEVRNAEDNIIVAHVAQVYGRPERPARAAIHRDEFLKDAIDV